MEAVYVCDGETATFLVDPLKAFDAGDRETSVDVIITNAAWPGRTWMRMDVASCGDKRDKMREVLVGDRVLYRGGMGREGEGDERGDSSDEELSQVS